MSIIIFIFGLAMIGYWAKYLIDEMPLEHVPIIPEGITIILAILTGIGFFRVKKWSFVTGILLSGFWMYGCISGINIVLYDLIKHGELKYQSPIGAFTDAILFIIVTCFAVFLVIYINKIERLLKKE